MKGRVFFMRKMEISNGNLSKRITLEKALENFLKNRTIKNLSEDSIKYYQEKCSYFIRNIKATYIDEVNKITIEDFKYSEKMRNSKTTTINAKLRGIRAFLYFCMEENYIPTYKIPLLKQDVVEKEPYSNEELSILVEPPKSNKWTAWRNWALENYMLATGNRIGTIRAIKIKDLDFNNNQIKLSSTKNRKQQIIPMSSSLKSVLLRYLSTWEHTENDFLFPQYEGKQIARRTLQQAISEYNKKRGVSKTSGHLFRHTFAKKYIVAGGNMTKLQKLLGHSTLTMTTHYINLYGSDLAENYDKLNPLNNTLKDQ